MCGSWPGKGKDRGIREREAGKKRDGGSVVSVWVAFCVFSCSGETMRNVNKGSAVFCVIVRIMFVVASPHGWCGDLAVVVGLAVCYIVCCVVVDLALNRA